jgi:hypothetical protein
MLSNLFKFWGNDVIEFYCHPSLHEIIPEPKPAIKFLPEWYKTIPPVNKNKRDDFGDFAMSAKKCFPMIDAMSLGFVIPLCGDLHVKVNEDMTEMKFTNPPGMKLAENHSITQIGGETGPGYPIDPIKFINYWVVKTAPGWSTLFVSPLNHVKTPFTCLSGLVDTDKYPKEVNFPAIWNEASFDGIITAGTPLVTAIPIKREVYAKKPKVRKMSTKEFNEIEKIRKKQHSRKHVYTQELRVKK